MTDVEIDTPPRETQTHTESHTETTTVPRTVVERFRERVATQPHRPA